MKKFSRNSILLCLALMPVACFAHGPTGMIKGTVIGIDGVLQRATVTIKNAGAATDSAVVLTSVDGTFIQILKAGIYSCIITHTGYEKNVTEIKIEPGNTLTAYFIMTPAIKLGEEVSLPSRSMKRYNNLLTPVAVDVISSYELLQTGRTGLPQMLNIAVPSLNASRELIIEAITIRGMNPDQMLVLVDGKRYHTMAIVGDAVRGQLGRGTVAYDLNSIPISAIDRIEILYDGAAAQFGSDAIAGVMDIRLKRSTGNTSVQLHAGQCYEGDGESINVGINHGIELLKKSLPAGRQGFLNLSADFRIRDYTHRGGKFNGAVYYGVDGYSSPQLDSILALDNQKIKERGFDRSYATNAGTSKLTSLGFLLNSGYPVGKKTEIFLTTALNNRETIFTGAYGFPKNSRQINPDLFPDGFKFKPIIKAADISCMAGVRGETNNKWYLDYTSAYGGNIIDLYPTNTNNPSQYYTLGKYAPTKFYLGTLIYQQLTNNFNLAKEFYKKNSGAKMLDLGLGAEWRLENYQLKAGEEAAWRNYDTLGRKNAGVQFAPIMHPENAVNKTRNVLATYVDLESEVNGRLLINLSGRYEYYTDFGGNLAGKLGIRYKISNRVNLRGSFSNGFRAPNLQQRFYSTTSHSLTNVDGRVVGVTNGLFRNDDEVVKALGIPSLGAEKSLNLGTGITATILKRMTLTMDAYWIQVKDRIVQSGVFDRTTNRQIDSVLFRMQRNIQRLEFFSNAINTRTWGIDLMVNSTWNTKKTALTITLGMNINRTRLFGEIKVAKGIKPDSLSTNTLYGRLERMRLERGQPGHKIILLVNYKIGRIGFKLQNTLFGKTIIASLPYPNDPSYDEHNSSKILTDLSLSHSVKKWLTLTAGANNISDVYPDRLKNYKNTGEGQFIYSQEASPFGYSGGYYYMSMSFSFNR